MAEERPSPFATLPHGFHYHYEEPKTPERESAPAVQQEVPAPVVRGFKVRRTRPRIDTGSISSRTSDVMAGLHDNPVPSIEIGQQDVDQTPKPPIAVPKRLLTPLHQIAKTFPQTPMDRRFQRSFTPSNQEISVPERPLSPFSGVSDSSDDSFVDSEDDFSYSGSLTSPDSDAADFTWDSPTKAPLHSADLNGKLISSPTPGDSTPKKYWTKDMDSHIWKVYTTYLNDPTVTPFKTLPGCPPPVGVCYRVAREARRSWKSGRSTSGTQNFLRQLRDGPKSADSITSPRNPIWPGGGSATRKRFRMLCKRKATIAPHYQRMIRSASPYLENTTGHRVTSPMAGTWPSTRDMTMSLATSTATTMQPDGPLAQISNDEATNDQPQAPWASPAPVPSDVESNHTMDSSPVIDRHQSIQEIRASAENITCLGSPFNNARTWGPSRSRNLERPPAMNLLAANNGSDTAPRLRSPFHFQTVAVPKPPSMMSTIRYRPAQRSLQTKRPAQSDLEESLSSVDAEARRNRAEDVFASGMQDASLRLRNRGLSLGAPFVHHHASEAVTIAGPVPVNPARRAHFASLQPIGVYASGIEDPFGPSKPEPAPRLGSPFVGISARPSRSRRHVSSLSMPGAVADYESIDQRMEGAQ